MGIRICGHQIRFAKPIKTYTLLKASCLVLMIGAIALPPANAADTATSKTSTCAAVPCNLPQDGYGPTAAPATKNISPHRNQRTAGTNTMSPALALVMALGLRNVQGPVERSKQVVVRHDAQPIHLGQKKASMNAAGVRLALDD